MNQEKPVVLVHGYGYSNADTPIRKLLIHARKFLYSQDLIIKPVENIQASLHVFDYLQIAATTKLWEEGRVSRIVLAAGSLDIGNPSVALLVRKQLIDQSIPGDVIELAPFGKSTRKEVKTFNSLCRQFDWQNVMFLSIKDHQCRVKRAVYRLLCYPNKASFLTSEDVLRQEEPYGTFIDGLYKSDLFVSFRKMESLKNKIDQHFDGKLLDLMDIFLPYKGLFQNLALNFFKG